MAQKISIKYPEHVPQELRSVWMSAAQRLASKGELLRDVRTASGKYAQAIDYSVINRDYQRILLAYAGEARKAGGRSAARDLEDDILYRMSQSTKKEFTREQVDMLLKPSIDTALASLLFAGKIDKTSGGYSIVR